MARDNQGLYTEKDLEILEEIKDLRLNIVRANKKNALEGDSRAARLINELSSSVESSIHTQVANKIKFKEASNNEMVIENVAELLRNAKSSLNGPRTENVETLAPEYQEITLVPGELETDVEKLELEHFTAKYDEKE